MNSDKHAIRLIKGENKLDIEESFQYLYNKYSKLVMFCILSIVKDTRDAEELTNDVFIKIFNNRKNLCEDKNVKYYILKVARNHTLDFLKKKKLDVILDDEYIFNYQSCIKNDIDLNVIEFINKHLNNMESEIVISHLTYEYSFEEIASHFELSVNTVKTKYYRSIKKLHKEMRDYNA